MLASWKNIRLCDLLKLSADVRNLKGNGSLLLKEKYCRNKFTRFAHCLRTLLSSSHRCLPMLHSWAVAKMASRQENQIDEKEIGDIWNCFPKISVLIYLRVDLVSVTFSCRETQQSKCALPSRLCSGLRHMAADGCSPDLVLLALWQLSWWNHGGLHPPTGS